MATTFKTLLPSDVVDTRTKLHENIPITGTIVSGTYNNENIQTHTHAMFTAVYDYPYLSSSANHIFDITYGYASNLSASTGRTQNAKKLNIYNQFLKKLLLSMEILNKKIKISAKKLSLARYGQGYDDGNKDFSRPPD